MMIDSHIVPEGKIIETSVCIVGAGVAGITLAQELIGANINAGLFECGDSKPDVETQSYFWGKAVGHPYYPLDMTRSCGFGGSAHRWNIDLQTGAFGVRLHPLDAIDFAEREWVPNSGWPFGKPHLDFFYERAHKICKIGPYSYEAGDWENPVQTPRLPFKSDRVQTTIFQFADRMTFIKDHFHAINAADKINVYTHANVVEIETDEEAKVVNSLRLTSSTGKKFSVKAKLYILALGAIETARLLLLSNKVQKNGLGNQNDLVGRYFMEHPHLWSGRYIPSCPELVKKTGLYALRWNNGTPIMGKLTINQRVQKSQKLLNYCVSIHPEIYKPRPNIMPDWDVVSWPLLDAQNPLGEKKYSTPYEAVFRRTHSLLSRIYRRLKPPDISFKLNHMTEQIPNPDSRIFLIEEKDALDRNRVCLDWRLSSMDISSIRHSQEILDEELQRSGLGRLQIDLSQGEPPMGLQGGWHHMGTTRMQVNPKKGVVDENGKVHGISNLFIAGPSVFPTCGYANPVLTIVALAIRLADHIKSKVND
jgi:choline dehydrogenase-like flavoprotein